MIIEQMMVGRMSVFCYIVGCERSKEGMLIDPAGDEDRIMARVKKLGLNIKYLVNTHAHGDHTCGNAVITQKMKLSLVMSEQDAAAATGLQNKMFCLAMGFKLTPKPDLIVRDGQILTVGDLNVTVLHTPGHTPGGICLYIPGHVFTGDTLFVEAVGRTDLPGGSQKVLLKSIKEKLLTLPADTVVWPGHDYGSRPSSSIGYERENNPYVTDFLE
ncbi:MAG: MBL fold metallo-hydrolase [Deltaproteobacteria bacterium]|nr:MBL fold metallo-hydrolase [Deltaproteobacteria bacterium]